MTTANFTSEINWLIDNSEVHYSDNECEMMRFKGVLAHRTFSRIIRFFKENGGLSIKVGMGSINIILPTNKSEGNKIEFNACLAK